MLGYQNCAPSSENTLSVPGARTTGSTGGNTGGGGNNGGGGNQQPCGAGMYRPTPTSNCRLVSDTQYAPGDDGMDTAIECPQGSSSAGTPKSTLSDCRPLAFYKTTPFEMSSACTGTVSVIGLDSGLYGCLTGLSVTPGVEPQTQACATITCARPAENALPPATCTWVGFRQISPTQVNAEWSWEPTNNRFTTTTANGTPVNLAPIVAGATGEPMPGGGYMPCNGNLRPWVTTYWRRADGGTTAPLSICMGACN